MLHWKGDCFFYFSEAEHIGKASKHFCYTCPFRAISLLKEFRAGQGINLVFFLFSADKDSFIRMQVSLHHLSWSTEPRKTAI